MKRTILFILFVCFCLNVSVGNNQDTLTAKKITITTSLTDYFPRIYFYAIRYNIGAEVYMKNRKSIFASLGFIHSNGSEEKYYRAALLSKIFLNTNQTNRK